MSSPRAARTGSTAMCSPIGRATRRRTARTRLSFNNSWRKVNGLQPSLDGSDNPTTNYTKGTTFPNWLFSGNADYVISPSFFVGVRAGYFRTDQHDFNVPNVSRYAFGNTT